MQHVHTHSYHYDHNYLSAVQFEEGVDLSGVEGFTISYDENLGEGSLILYQYRPKHFNSSSGIETDGKTYAKNIPFNTVRSDTTIAVFITTSDTVYPSSQPFTLKQCSSQDTTTTGAQLHNVYLILKCQDMLLF